MNKQQPDKLFGDKLTHYERPVPPGAWSRIETNLDGTGKRAFPYWRAAAAVLVIGVASYLLLRDQSDAPTPIAKSETQGPIHYDEKDNAEEMISADVLPADEARPDVPKPAEKMDSPSPGPAIQKNLPKPLGKMSERIATDESALAARPSAESEKADIAEFRETSEEHLAMETHIATSGKSDSTEPASHKEIASSESRANITLVMTTADTDAYLEKKPIVGATSGSRKTSTLKRVLQKASELKNNDEDPFGDLRQMKNEILALNFKGDKQRSSKQAN